MKREWKFSPGTRRNVSLLKLSIHLKCVIKRYRDSMNEMLRITAGRSFDLLNRVDRCNACARAVRSRSQYEAEDSIKRWKRRKIQRGLSKTRALLSFPLFLPLPLSFAREFARSRISPTQLRKRSLTPKAFKRIKFSRIVYDKMFPFNLSNHRRALQTFANLIGERD